MIFHTSVIFGLDLLIIFFSGRWDKDVLSTHMPLYGCCLRKCSLGKPCAHEHFILPQLWGGMRKSHLKHVLIDSTVKTWFCLVTSGWLRCTAWKFKPAENISLQAKDKSGNSESEDPYIQLYVSFTEFKPLTEKGYDKPFLWCQISAISLQQKKYGDWWSGLADQVRER